MKSDKEREQGGREGENECESESRERERKRERRTGEKVISINEVITPQVIEYCWFSPVRQGWWACCFSYNFL